MNPIELMKTNTTSALFYSSILAATLMPARAFCAVEVSVMPSTQTIAVGGSASVDIWVTGAFVGGFDAELNYAPGIVLPSSYAIGSSLGSYDGANDFSLFPETAGKIRFIYLSTASIGDLMSLQSTLSFKLATITFQGLALGDSPLALGSVVLSALDGTGSVTIDTIGDANLTVVPEPATYLAGFSALAMLGLFGWRTRQ